MIKNYFRQFFIASIIMSTIESESSGFWNLSKNSNLNSKSDSEPSDFWNLSRNSNLNSKSDSESSGFWNLTKTKYDTNSSEDFSTDDETDESESNNKITESKIKDNKKKSIVNLVKPLSNQSIPNNDLTIVNIENNKIPILPPNQISYTNKKIGDYTIKEFYNNFMKNIIGMVKSLRQGKGLNQIFEGKDTLIHFGIILIIISILLVPLTLN